jgi:hypothetical protein
MQARHTRHQRPRTATVNNDCQTRIDRLLDLQRVDGIGGHRTAATHIDYQSGAPTATCVSNRTCNVCQRRSLDRFHSATSIPART